MIHSQRRKNREYLPNRIQIGACFLNLSRNYDNLYTDHENCQALYSNAKGGKELSEYEANKKMVIAYVGSIGIILFILIMVKWWMQS